jgi:hypothetical protein
MNKTFGRQRRRELLKLIARARDQRHAHAFVRQRLRNGPADPTAGASNNSDFAR